MPGHGAAPVGGIVGRMLSLGTLLGLAEHFWEPSLQGHCVSPPLPLAATSPGQDAGVEAHLPWWDGCYGLISISRV